MTAARLLFTLLVSAAALQLPSFTTKKATTLRSSVDDAAWPQVAPAAGRRRHGGPHPGWERGGNLLGACGGPAPALQEGHLHEVTLFGSFFFFWGFFFAK